MKRFRELKSVLEKSRDHEELGDKVKSMESEDEFLDKEHPAAKHMIRRYLLEAIEDDGELDQTDRDIAGQLGNVAAGFFPQEVNDIAEDFETDYRCTLQLSRIIQEIDTILIENSDQQTLEESRSIIRAQILNQKAEYNLGEYDSDRIDRCLENLLSTRDAIIEAFDDGIINSEEFELLSKSARSREVTRQAFIDMMRPYTKDNRILVVANGDQEIFENTLGRDPRFIVRYANERNLEKMLKLHLPFVILSTSKTLDYVGRVISEYEQAHPESNHHIATVTPDNLLEPAYSNRYLDGLTQYFEKKKELLENKAKKIPPLRPESHAKPYENLSVQNILEE